MWATVCRCSFKNIFVARANGYRPLFVRNYLRWDRITGSKTFSHGTGTLKYVNLLNPNTSFAILCGMEPGPVSDRCDWMGKSGLKNGDKYKKLRDNYFIFILFTSLFQRICRFHQLKSFTNFQFYFS